MKKEATAKSIVKDLVQITIRLKRKIGDIHVGPIQKSTYFTTLKLPKLRARGHTPLTSQLHKTSMEMSTFTTV